MLCTRGNNFFVSKLCAYRPIMAIVEECLVVFKQLHEQQYKSYPNQSIQVNYAVFFSSEYNAKRYLKIIQSLGGTSRVKALLSVYNLYPRRNRKKPIDDTSSYEFSIPLSACVTEELVNVVEVYERTLSDESDQESAGGTGEVPFAINTSESLETTESADLGSNESGLVDMSYNDDITGGIANITVYSYIYMLYTYAYTYAFIIGL